MNLLILLSESDKSGHLVPFPDSVYLRQGNALKGGDTFAWGIHDL